MGCSRELANLSSRLLMVVPENAPVFDNEEDGATDLLANPDIEEKLDLIRDNSRVSAHVQRFCPRPTW